MRVLITLLFFLPLTTLNAQSIKLADIDRATVYIGDESPQAYHSFQQIKNTKNKSIQKDEVVFQAFPAKGLEQELFLQKDNLDCWDKIEKLFSLNPLFIDTATEQEITYLPECLVEDKKFTKKGEFSISYIGENPKAPEYLLISIDPRQSARVYVLHLGSYDAKNYPLGKERTLLFSGSLGKQNYVMRVSKDEKWIVQHRDAFRLKEESSYGGITQN